MGATLDRSQKIGFYFGNAAEDLAHLLPHDDAPAATKVVSLELQEIQASLEQAERFMVQIKDSRRKLSFLIADLKRMIA